MYFVGVDLHKDTVSFYVIDQHNEYLHKTKIHTKSINKICNYLRSIPKPFILAVEAVGFYQWFYKIAEYYAQKVFLANATEVRARFPKVPKTDYKDAYRLAELLKTGLFDRDYKLSSFVPDDKLRELRTLTRRRNNLTRKLINEKNSFRRQVLQFNLKGPKHTTSSYVIRWLRGFANKLPEPNRDILWQIFHSIAYLEKQKLEIELAIEKLVSNNPQWQRLHTILTSIPGIGNIVAWTLIAEVGDFSRFDKPEELVSYAGLAPRVFQSGQTVRYGRITKQGHRDIRWMLEEAGWVAIRSDSRCKSIFNRIAKRAGRKKAAVAIARKLLVWSYWLIKYNTPYRKSASYSSCA